MNITDLWNFLFIDPMLNGLILLYGLLFQNFGLTIVVFTLLVRLVILPLTLQQLRASKSMMAIQPHMAALQKKYANDRQQLSQEQMKLYREHGVNPLGCAIPTLIQFPIWIGLYQSIIQALAATPENLLSLSQHLYPGLPQVQQLVPLQSHFLWLDLSRPDPWGVFPVLVAASMWVSQKMMTMPTEDPRQRQMNEMMQWMMPIMFGFFTLQFPSGLAIYWVVSNVISMVIQYFVTGWGSLFPRLATAPASKSAPASQDPSGQTRAQTLGKGITNGESTDGKSRGKRKNRRRGRRTSPAATKGQPLPSGDRGS